MRRILDSAGGRSVACESTSNSMRLRPLLLAVLSLTFVASLAPAKAAEPYFAAQFRLHDFDDKILASLGHPSASIVYFREIASLTEDQARVRRQFDPIGCHAFYVMLGGQLLELGYNCRTFFCVGYVKGPRQCLDTRQKAYSGVAEISRRLGLVTIQDTRKLYEEYDVNDRTPEMKKRIEDLAVVRCRPLYLQEFDVVVGDGYSCDEIGRFPQFSGSFTCMDDSRNKEGLVCSIPQRDEEMKIRADIVARGLAGPAWSRSSSSAASVSSSSAASAFGTNVSSVQSSSSVSSLPLVTFPDVDAGKYGYTAITALASRQIITGYPDGTFRPKNVVNRAEFLQMLLRGVHPNQLRQIGECFPDVRSEWFSPVVCTAKSLGWVNGYANGRFHPERTMKRSEAIKVIVSSLGQPLDSRAALPIGVSDSAWYTPYIRKAVELGIILETSFQAEGEVTRADAAVWMYRSAKLMKRL